MDDTSTNGIRTVAVIDEHRVVIRGVEAELSLASTEFEVVGSFAHPGDIDLSGVPVDIVVLGVRLNLDDTAAFLPWIESLVAWGAKVLLHASDSRTPLLREAISRGACGLCLKADDALTESLRAVRDKGFSTSSHEADAMLTGDLPMRAGADEIDPLLLKSPEEFGYALNLLRDQRGLSIRQVARASDIPTATLGGYFTGRHLPLPTQPQVLNALLVALGVEPAHQGAWRQANIRLRRLPGSRQRAQTPRGRGGDSNLDLFPMPAPAPLRTRYPREPRLTAPVSTIPH